MLSSEDTRNVRINYIVGAAIAVIWAALYVWLFGRHSTDNPSMVWFATLLIGHQILALYPCNEETSVFDPEARWVVIVLAILIITLGMAAAALATTAGWRLLGAALIGLENLIMINAYYEKDFAGKRRQLTPFQGVMAKGSEIAMLPIVVLGLIGFLEIVGVIHL